MTIRIAAPALLALSLTVAACQPAVGDADYAVAESAAADASSPETVAVSERAPAPAPVARIAYAFRYALALPLDEGASVMSRHEQACVTAGPGQCQVLSASADWTGRNARGRLEFRGSPDWINAFRSGLADDARAAGGRLLKAETVGEDVTRGLRSADATLRVNDGLSKRLADLQARRGGSLEDRTRIEREIAALERQIAEQRVERQSLEDRVRSATLTIDYGPSGVWAADSRFHALAVALSGSLGVATGVAAVLVYVASGLLPVGVLIGLGWLVWRRLRPRPAIA